MGTEGGERPVYFCVHGVLFVGKIVCWSVNYPVYDELLVALSWPPETVVVTDVRLLMLDALVAPYMIIPAAALLDFPEGQIGQG